MAPKAAAKAAAGKKSKYVRKARPVAGANKRSVAPGTVAIMLAGKYRGRHCVVLKSLEHSAKKNGKDQKCGTSSLVVSGPFKYNGIPVRRVNPRYIIATSTKVNIGNLDGLNEVTNATFKRAKSAKKAKSAKSFMSTKKGRADAQAKLNAGKKAPADRVALQKRIDAGLIKAIKADANGKLLPGYLKSVFCIKPGDQPHRMKF
jgi:large subunit ribosomal protein L6e